MTIPGTCQNCGNPLIPGTNACPYCGQVTGPAKADSQPYSMAINTFVTIELLLYIPLFLFIITNSLVALGITSMLLSIVILAHSVVTAAAGKIGLAVIWFILGVLFALMLAFTIPLII